jgi:hypothetical protein
MHLLQLLMHIVYWIIDFVNPLNVLVHFEMVLHWVIQVAVLYDYHLAHQNFHLVKLVLTNQVIVLLNQLFIGIKKQTK